MKRTMAKTTNTAASKTGAHLFKDLFIFEMANNHQGSVAHGKKIISEMAKIKDEKGIRGAIKFQFRHLDTFIHPEHRNKKDNKHIPRFLSTRLSDEQFRVLADHARARGLLTVATPFDERSVDLIDELKIDFIKIASCSAGDWPLLERVVQSGKPVIVSTGGLEIKEIDKLYSFFSHRYATFALLHCVGIYPTPPEHLYLNHIAVMRKRYPDVVIGFSTHEEIDNYDAIKIAYAKGARIFERHVGVPTKTITLNAYSSSPKEVRQWIDAWRRAVVMLGDERGKQVTEEEKASLASLKRGVYAARKIRRGEKLKNEDVFFAMPLLEGQLSSGEFKSGLRAKRDYCEASPILETIKRKTTAELVYEAIHEIRGMIHEAGLQVGHNFELELSHHYGLKSFRKTGVAIFNYINREYCKKLLIVLPGQAHPLHHHKKKEETFHVLHGTLLLEIDGKQKILYPGDIEVIQRGVSHRFWSEEGAIFEEISSTHFNDDSFYSDHKINAMPREERKTILKNWGRHHFE